MTILAAFGMPGVMSSWGFAALHALAREALGEYAIIESDAVEDLLEHLRRLPAQHAVLTSQYPEARLSSLIKQAKLPFVLFLEDPLDAVSYLARCTGEQDLKLVRAVSASLACVLPMKDHPEALNISRDSAGATRGIGYLLDEMNQHLHVNLKPDAIARCLPHLGMTSAKPTVSSHFEDVVSTTIAGYVLPKGSEKGLSPELRQIASKVLPPLPPGEKNFPPISWPQQAFFQGDKPGEPIEEIIDLTGAARCLIYGPYLHLPAGHWHARIILGIGEDAFGQTFTIEIHASTLLGRLRVRPSGTGLFVATIPFAVTEPKTPIEIRLLMDSGAIEGSISSWTVEMLVSYSPST